MMQLFSEKISVLFLQRNRMTAIEVESPFTVKSSRFKVKILASGSPDSVDSVIKSLPDDIPVVLGSQSPVHWLDPRQKTNQSTEAQEIPDGIDESTWKKLKPVLTESGTIWHHKSGEIYADCGDLSELKKRIDEHGRVYIGTVSLSETLNHQYPRQTAASRLLITGHNNRFTLLAFFNDSLIACRSFQCPTDHLVHHLSEWMLRTQQTHSQWLPRGFHWLGNDCPMELEQHLPRHHRQQMESDINYSEYNSGEALAIATAVCWLEKRRRKQYRELGSLTLKPVRIVQRTSLLLHIVLCILMALTAVGTLTISKDMKEYQEHINKQQSEQSKKIQGLPGTHYPIVHPDQIRPHQHINALAEMTGSEIIISTFQLNPERLELTGTATTIEAINVLSRTLTEYFSERHSTIETPETRRNELGDLTFKVAVNLGDSR